MAVSRITTFSLMLGTGLFIAVSDRGISDEPSSQHELAKKYKDLIEQLVSPNKEAITRNGANGSVKFPAGYDVQAQRHIEAARQELHKHFEEALPFLIEALDDDRYCMTISWADYSTTDLLARSGAT